MKNKKQQLVKVSRKKIEETISLIKKIQSLTGKKVLFKEAVSEEAEGNKIVDDLQEFMDSFSELKGLLNPLNKKGNKNLNRALEIINSLQQKASELIQEETQHEDDTTEPIEEDVDMDIDQIMSQPDTINKLNQKKINVNLVDKNNRNTSSTSTSTVNTIGA